MYTYYDAVAVEYAGLGVYGKKLCAPDVDARESSVVLARVMVGDEAADFRKRARGVGNKCRKAGGRKIAAGKAISALHLIKEWRDSASLHDGTSV